MGNLILGLKDERQLLETLVKSIHTKQTPAQIREQRVSFVVGSLGKDSTVTRDQVRKELAKQDGAN